MGPHAMGFGVTEGHDNRNAVKAGMNEVNGSKDGKE